MPFLILLLIYMVGILVMNRQKRAKIILVPYPAQGHVTPMLNLASVLAHQNFRPVVVTTEFIHRSISSQIDRYCTEISFIGIPDGIEEGRPRDFFAIEKAMENTMPFYLEEFIDKIRNHEDNKNLIACIVVDLLASWAINVGWQRGIPVAGFWPAMVETYQLITAIPDMIQTGFISDTGIPQCEGPMLLKSIEPSISSEDLPWLIGTPTERKARFKFWTTTLKRSKSLKWLLINSHPNHINNDKMPPKQIKTDNVSNNYPQFLPIGFTYDDRRTKNASFWEEDLSCLDWLDQQNNNSVLYISFGSWVSPMGDTCIKSLALALESLAQPFLWVLRANWRNGLPEGYIKRVSNYGQIVLWAPQLKVLQHKAVGCYLTHCGWNSTVEAIQCGKRMLCYPLAGDQFLNCKYIVQVWRVGVRLNGFEYRDLEDGMKKLKDDDKLDKRLAELNERMMGKEARLRMKNNVEAFANCICREQCAKRRVDKV